MNNSKRYYVLASVTGLALWLSWPMMSFSFLLFIAFVPLLFLEHEIAMSNKNAGRQLFKYSFLAFFIWNLLCSYWLWNASAFGMFVAVLLNSSMMSTVFVAYHYVKKKNNFLVGAIFFICFWMAMELLHHHWDFAWPWMSLGNAFSARNSWVQWYEYTGIFGGSLWVLLSNVLLFNAYKNYQEKKYYNKLVLLPIAVILIPFAFSIYRYNTYIEKENPCNIVVVQPNIDPYGEKFSGLSPEAQVNRLIRLSDSVAQKNTEFFLWPETALQNNLPEENLEANPLIIVSRQFLSKYKNGNIVTGADTYRTYQKEETPTARKFKNGECCYDAFNAAFLIENNPGIQVYHKSKLVAGVEQMPYPSVLKILKPLALDMGGTFGSLGTQTERSVFYSKSGIGVAPVICYESVFGEYLSEYIKNGAQFIAIVTNDGWWGNTAGHKQHAEYAKLRAIETRRSIARSANTGISSFINQRGDVIAQTNYWVPDALNGNINLNEEITFYVQYGDWYVFTASLISILLLAYTFIKEKLLR